MRLNGKQTIYQMMQLAARIRERGGEAKEPLWYKHEYLRRLDLRIKDRIDGLRQGTIPADDLLVHGARRLLENLKDRGLPVYLASGTDEIFVKQEAELLGLTPYFGPGSTAPRMISRRSPRSWSCADHPRERHPRRTVSLLRRRLRRDREHQGGRRPGRRRGQRRGQQRLWSDGRVETRAALGHRRRGRDSRLPRRRSSSGVDSGTMNTMPLDLGRLNVHPLVERDSLTCVEDILLSPDAPPAACPELVLDQVRQCAAQVLEARKNGAGVILIYRAHLLRNGTARILGRMMERGWITHLATNGAGTIHDWEYAWLGRSTESVRANVATGTFGSWDETGRNIHLALLAGGLRDEGYGRAWSVHRRRRGDDSTRPGAGGSDSFRSRPSAHAGASRCDSRHLAARHCLRTDHGHAQLEARVDPGPGLWLPGADDRASGNRLRHHRQSPDFNGAVIGRAATTISGSSAARSRPWTAGWSCRSARRSWGRRSSRRASVA